MNIELVKNRLINTGMLREIVFLEELDSTNKFAKRENIENDVLVLTSNQTTGRGRFERSWNSEKDNDITMSLVKSFDLNNEDIHLVTFYASLIIIEVLKKHCRDGEKKFFLKWPNDILLNGKKVSGIMIDAVDIKSKMKKLIIGIGINVNRKLFEKDLSRKATSLALEFGRDSDLEKIISDIIENIYDNISLLKEKKKLMDMWKSNSNIFGKEALIRVFENSKEKRIKIIDVDLDGGIKVEIENEVKIKYFSGDITVIETY